MSTAIIVPCRNEAGEIEALLRDILLNLKPSDLLVIVEGGSQDQTWEIISTFSSKYDNVIAVQQDGSGKFDAVLTGIRLATQEYIMIWDADGTVALIDNLRIYDFQSPDDFVITGDRLRGSREHGSMQKFNFLGNWLFAITWGLLLQRKPFDTLCGTKKLPRKLLLEAPDWLLQGDPYGDFAILGAARLKQISIQSIPVNYAARKYGKTNIHRWSGGTTLLLLVIKIIRKGSSR